MKRTALSEFDVIYVPLSMSINPENKTVGYIKRGEQWHWCTPYEAENILPNFHVVKRIDGSYYTNCSYDRSRSFAEQLTGGNLTLFHKICKLMKEGDSFEHFKSLCSTVKLESHPPLTLAERMITKITRPVIERDKDNQNQNTFDFITIECNLLKNYDGDRTKYIKDHITEINKMVLDKIANSASFKAYNVPVNILKATSIRIYGDVLIYKFEIKEPKAIKQN